MSTRFIRKNLKIISDLIKDIIFIKPWQLKSYKNIIQTAKNLFIYIGKYLFSI